MPRHSFHREFGLGYGKPRSLSPLDEKKIFVGGLPHNLTDMQFELYFTKFGRVTDAIIKKPRGIAIVYFHYYYYSFFVHRFRIYHI